MVLFLVLGALVVVVLAMKLGGPAEPTQPSSPARPAQQRDADGAKIDPAGLDVRLETLERMRPAPAEAERNPFRFQAKAAPPPASDGAKPKVGPVGPTVPPPPAPPPGPPPITVKFIGTLQLSETVMVALFTDCTEGRRMSSKPVREGEIILGQYRLVKIGLTSVVVEHLDGRGRTTLPKTGQECVK